MTTKTQERRALNDIKRKVREIMRDCTRDAIKSLDKLQYLEGVNIARDHIEDGSSHRIVKDFMTAYAQELASSRGYGPVKPTPRSQAKRIDLYFRHI